MQVHLRELHESDLSQTFLWHNDPHLSAQILSFPPPIVWEQESLWFKRCQELEKQGQRYTRIIESIDEENLKTPVGLFIVENKSMSDEPAWEVGMFIFPPHLRRLGLGKIALAEGLKLCEKWDKSRPVFLVVRSDNAAAIEFYKKSGFLFDSVETIHKYNQSHQVVKMVFKKQPALLEISFFSLALFFLTLPFILVGIDFTDFGYHYINQLDFGILNGALRNSCYFWLSDFLSGILVHLSGGYYMSLKLSGVFVWCVLGGLIYRHFASEGQVSTSSLSEKIIVALAFLGALLLSGSSLGQGSTLIGDYYVIPVIFVFGLFLSIKNFISSSNSNRKFFGILILSFLLPLFRWPLLIISIFSVSSLSFLTKLTRWQRIYIYIFLPVFLIGCFFYHSLFLVPTLGMSQADSYAFNGIIRSNITDLKIFSTLTFIGLLLWMAYFSFQYLKRLKGFLLYLFSSVFFLAGVLFVFFLQESIQRVFLHSIWFYSSHIIFFICSVYLVSQTFLKSKNQNKQNLKFLFFSIIFAALYGLGSNNGFLKSGYFAFLPLIFTFLHIRKSLTPTWISSTLALGLFFLGLMQFYQNTYRDDLTSVLSQPRVISDSVMGWQITQPKTVAVIEDLKNLLNQHPHLKEKSAVIQESPLLNAYLSKPDKTLIFLGIKYGKQRLKWVEDSYQSGHVLYLIQAKLNLADPRRASLEWPINEKCQNPSWQSEFFRVIEVRCLMEDRNYFVQY